jgi:hypothetical protein
MSLGNNALAHFENSGTADSGRTKYVHPEVRPLPVPKSSKPHTTLLGRIARICARRDSSALNQSCSGDRSGLPRCSHRRYAKRRTRSGLARGISRTAGIFHILVPVWVAKQTGSGFVIPAEGDSPLRSAFYPFIAPKAVLDFSRGYSNPRYSYEYGCFSGSCLRPLGHLCSRASSWGTCADEITNNLHELRELILSNTTASTEKSDEA